MLQSKQVDISELAMLTSALMFGHQNVIFDFCTTLETQLFKALLYLFLRWCSTTTHKKRNYSR